MECLGQCLTPSKSSQVLTRTPIEGWGLLPCPRKSGLCDRLLEQYNMATVMPRLFLGPDLKDPAASASHPGLFALGIQPLGREVAQATPREAQGQTPAASTHLPAIAEGQHR